MEKTIEELTFDFLEIETKRSGEMTKEQKDLVHEIADRCRKTEIYKIMENGERHGFDHMTTEELIRHMCIKIAGAPNELFRKAAIRILMPIIDDRLQEGK